MGTIDRDSQYEDETPRGSRSTAAQHAAHRRRKSRGQSLVELALVLPVVLLLVMAALDFGRAFFGWVVLNNAARVGANYAALHPDAWGTPGDAADQATYANLVTGARGDTEVSFTGCSTAAVPAPQFPGGTDIGDYAEVVLDCGFTPLTPIIGDVFAGVGNPLNVTARSVFPIRAGAVAGVPQSPQPSCLADFTWAARGGDESLTVDFTDATPPTSASWIWNLGDGLGSALQNPTHDYASAGSYTVTLAASSNGINCTPYVDVVTVIEPPPTPDPSASPEPSTSPPPPTPEPPCTVPSFIGTKKNNSAATWSSVGFTTPIIYDPDPNGNWTIEAQSLVGGQDAPCNTPITLGPNPLPTPAP